jgi:hypothetical protein
VLSTEGSIQGECSRLYCTGRRRHQGNKRFGEREANTTLLPYTEFSPGQVGEPKVLLIVPGTDRHSHRTLAQRGHCPGDDELCSPEAIVQYVALAIIRPPPLPEQRSIGNIIS